jgi:NDP-sugar pyrophosphorylase family protein
MQAVILAGGLGTRLRPITEHIPKPMVEVAGEPFLARIVCWLAKHDFRRQLLLLGYRGEVVSDYFGDGHRFGISIEYSREPSPLGTGGALRFALEKLEDEFLLLYGDSYLPIDYKQVARAFLTPPPCSGLMVVYDNRLGDTGVTGNVAVDGDGRVTRYAKNLHDADLQYVEAGVLCFRKKVFESLPDARVISLEQELYPELIANRQLRAFTTTQRFFDIGTPQRLEEFISKQ